jgi:hypothetical protein
MQLSDNLVVDPRMQRELHSQGVAHLAVRMRDVSVWSVRWSYPVSPAAWDALEWDHFQ